jgi:HTH-type transcriptional regulator/antitoxin HigA
MELRPIKTLEDYEAALMEIEKLMNAQLGTPESDRLEILATLIEAYEKEHYPIEPPDAVEAILYYLESRGLSEKDLVKYLGSEANVKAILQRQKSLTLDTIRVLHEQLGISADVLIQPYNLNRVSAEPVKKPGFLKKPGF